MSLKRWQLFARKHIFFKFGKNVQRKDYYFPQVWQTFGARGPGAPAAIPAGIPTAMASGEGAGPNLKPN